MGKEVENITKKICFSICVYFFVAIVLIIAEMFAGWIGALIVSIAFSLWLIIRTNRRIKAGTFNSSLLLGDFFDVLPEKGKRSL